MREHFGERHSPIGLEAHGIKNVNDRSEEHTSELQSH